MKSLISMFAAATVIIGSALVGAATVEVKPATAAVRSMAAESDLNGCNQQCYAQHDGDMAPCNRYAYKYGNSSMEYEMCAHHAGQVLTWCLDYCEATFGGQ